MQTRVQQLIAALAVLGIHTTIYSARRTIDEQKALYAKGWTRTLKSKHIEGRAVDLILDPPAYTLAGAIWTELGGKWGGNFKDPNLAKLEYQHFEDNA